VAAKFSDGRSRVSRHGRHRGSRVSTVLLDSRGDVKPTGGFAPHYFRRLAVQIGAAYVILAGGAFAAVGFALPSADSGSAAPVRIPTVVFPTTSPSPARTVGSVAASPGATTRAAATPSATPPPAIVPVSSVTVSPVAAPSDTSPAQAPVTVNYLVVAQYDGQFEGEVTVVNNGSAPISGWQIVVALSGDQITSFWGASGYISNDVLLLQPASDADALAADGTLSVYFTAAGPQTTPDVCAFDSVSCG
jgi:Cellulose binding domain